MPYVDAIPGEVDFEVVFEGDDDLGDDESSHDADYDEPEARPGQAEAALRVMSIVQGNYYLLVYDSAELSI